ncbi:hypothetical protein [Spirulina subsalsa]|uniref:hypothetical protein n=1 Tax=Spirulina subsalsa TaxID=54311 RepID=UPI000366BE19|nr:hypothetical protein [Spirulina subsalsa]
MLSILLDVGLPIVTQGEENGKEKVRGWATLTRQHPKKVKTKGWGVGQSARLFDELPPILKLGNR